MPPSATNQPPGSHGGVTLLRPPRPCSRGCSLPRKPCLLQSHGEAGFPLPEPQIPLLVAGKGFPNVSPQLAGAGLEPLEKSRGREEGRKEGGKQLCLLLGWAPQG